MESIVSLIWNPVMTPDQVSAHIVALTLALEFVATIIAHLSRVGR